MKKSVKVLSMVLASAMVLTMTGCSSKDTETAAASEAATEAKAEEWCRRLRAAVPG